MSNNLHKKNIFVVLGSSRSGTSAITRAMSALHIDLGEHLLKADSRNPKGFWEDSDILYKINRGVSKLLNQPLMSVGKLHEDEIIQNKQLLHFKNEAIKLLEERFKKRENWAFKDPRTVTIMPFWQSVFKSLEISDHYIIAIRNPLAMASSNQLFAQMDLEMGLMIWLANVFSSIESTFNKKRVIVCYEDILENPLKQLKRMQEYLSLSTPFDEIKAKEYANEFLDKKLKHHDFTETNLQEHSAMMVIPLCIPFYEMVKKIASDQISFNSDHFNVVWEDLKKEFLNIYPVYNYLDIQFKKNKKLASQIRKIEKSLMWKITFPQRLLRAWWHQRNKDI